jgi:hypothetical protein
VTWLTSSFRLSKAWAAWLQVGRLHLLNLGCTLVSIAYFDVSVETPFGVRSLPMYVVAPLITVLVATQPLCSSDSALIRQTAQKARGGVAAVRLLASLTILAVGVAALSVRSGSLLVGIPLLLMAFGVLCAMALNEFCWAPLSLGFMASLPWVLSDAGATRLAEWSVDGRVAVLGGVALAATSASYVRFVRARWPLARAIAAE